MLKKINHWWQNRRNLFYRRRRWHLAIDIFLVTIIFILAGLAIFLSSYHPVLNHTDITGPTATSTEDIASKPTYTISLESGSLIVRNGEDLTATVHFNNTGDTIISEVDMMVEFDSSAFELVSLLAEGGGVSVEGSKIMLKNIQPGETVSFNMQSKWRAIKSDFPRSLQSKLLVNAVSDHTRTIKEISLPEYRLISDLNIDANVYYHGPQGDQLGIGPIPPIVGVPTTYWFIVKAENEGNALANLVVSFHLPEGVELTGEASLIAGKYSYNALTRRVMWQVESVKASGGDYISNFALALTPREDQIGNDALLVDQIQYHADDTWTDSTISNLLSQIDTSLPADRFNREQGKVLAQ